MKKNKFEDSPKDEREDKAMAKKLGISKAKWERSAANKKHDMEGEKKMKKMAMGGKTDMMPPRGRPVDTGMSDGKSGMMPPRGRPVDTGMSDGKSGMMPPRGRPVDTGLPMRPANPGPSAVAQQPPMGGYKPSRPMPMPPPRPVPMTAMKAGGMVRGNGCAVRGKSKGKMV